MIRLQDMIDNSCELLDSELRELSTFIEEELGRREKEKETEAKKKIMKAIQDYLAAGYTLWVEGEIDTSADDFHAEYQSVIGSVESVDFENDQVTLNFIEER